MDLQVTKRTSPLWGTEGRQHGGLGKKEGSGQRAVVTTALPV